MTVTVKVVVFEDGEEVGATKIRYFEGQDYVVWRESERLNRRDA